MKRVPLTRGLFALVDDEDSERVNAHRWHASKLQNGKFYARRSVRLANGEQGKQYLHGFILGENGVDHKDGSGLNNQKQNLRKATQAQNLQGHRSKPEGATSQYRGVHWDSCRKKWAAKIKTGGRTFHLGRHSSEIEAARAYDSKAGELFGEFASPNFPCNKIPTGIQLEKD